MPYSEIFILGTVVFSHRNCLWFLCIFSIYLSVKFKFFINSWAYRVHALTSLRINFIISVFGYCYYLILDVAIGNSSLFPYIFNNIWFHIIYSEYLPQTLDFVTSRDCWVQLYLIAKWAHGSAGSSRRYLSWALRLVQRTLAVGLSLWWGEDPSCSTWSTELPYLDSAEHIHVQLYLSFEHCCFYGYFVGLHPIIHSLTLSQKTQETKMGILKCCLCIDFFSRTFPIFKVLIFIVSGDWELYFLSIPPFITTQKMTPRRKPEQS
jgi:hypothetical protein